MGNFLKKKNNRRKFLKKTVLLSTAAALSTFIPQTLSAKKIYNWKMVTTWPKNLLDGPFVVIEITHPVASPY